MVATSCYRSYVRKKVGKMIWIPSNLIGKCWIKRRLVHITLGNEPLLFVPVSHNHTYQNGQQETKEDKIYGCFQSMSDECFNVQVSLQCN